VPSSPRLRAAARDRSKRKAKAEAVASARSILENHDRNIARGVHPLKAREQLQRDIANSCYYHRTRGRNQEREMLRSQGRLEARRRG
jgi:hypothetical protein